MARTERTPLPAVIQEARQRGEKWCRSCRFFQPFADFGTDVSRSDSVGAWYQGNPCVGLDADQLAGALRVDRTTLIAANRDWSLIFLGTANMPPRHGGLRATAYGFRLGDREDYLTIETNPHEGTA